MNGNDWKLYVIVALVAALGGVGVPRLVPEAYRPDPWTGQDAKEAHAEMDARFRHYVDSQLDIHELRLLSKLPPAGTRQRIAALEREMQKLSPGFTPGALNFTHMGGGGNGE